MKKKAWVAVGSLMVLSLLIVSCGQEVVEQQQTQEPQQVKQEQQQAAPAQEASQQTEAESGAKSGLLPPDVPKYGGTLVVIGSNINGFDPAIVMSVMMTENRIMNEPLIQGDWAKGLAGTGETDWVYGYQGMTNLMTGALAESWEYPDDDTIIFHIRKGIHWWNKPPVNGRELTAEDAAWSIEREWAAPTGFLPTSNPPADHLISATALDKYTLEVKVPPQVQGAHLFLDGWYISILPPEIVDMYGDMNDWHNLVGTGAFIMTDYVPDSAITFERNDNYWGYDPLHPDNRLPYLDGIRKLIISDTSTQQAAFRTGKIDQLFGISLDDFEQFQKSNPQLQYYEAFASNAPQLSGREDKENLPFKDLRVRQAMNLAVDQRAILSDFYKGKGVLLSYPFVPSPAMKDLYVPVEDMPDAVQELFTYNPEKAKQLLTDAGYPNGFKTQVICSNAQVDLLSILRAYLLDVGIDMQLNVVEGGNLFRVLRGRTHEEMILSDNLLHVYWKMHNMRLSSNGNTAFWESPQSVEAYNTVAQNIGKNDDVVRQTIKDIAPHVLEKAWGVWLPHPYTYNIWQPWVQNYHGESNMGHLATHLYRNYIWVDEALKKSLGY